MTVPLFPVVQGAHRVEFFRTLTNDIRSLPGVIAVGAVGGIPVRGDAGSQVIFRGDDVNETVFLQRPIAGFRNTTPGYFAASGSTLLAGRFFTEHDPVTTAVVSESLAKLLSSPAGAGSVTCSRTSTRTPTTPSTFSSGN